jgi:hypothetical protein
MSHNASNLRTLSPNCRIQISLHPITRPGGFALLAVATLSFFSRPAWLLRQNSITLGIAAALGSVIAGSPPFARNIQCGDSAAAHPFPKPVPGSVIAEAPTWQRQAV